MLATNPQIEIRKVVFSKATYNHISDLKCGESQYARLAENWIKDAPPMSCAFKSIADCGTRVWIYLLDDCTVGFGAVGENWKRNKKYAYIPMLAVSKNFQSKKYRDGENYSDFIISDLINCAGELEHRKLCLLVHKDNCPAIKLYKKYEFKTDEKELKYGNIRMCRSI